ncbi:MAG: PorT family protein [Phycisphaerae bacterium]|nr:PorT family protein [Saprospiraceae bacterium]
MTKTVAAFFLLLFLNGQVFAQKLQYGFKAGPQLSSYTRTTDDKAALRYHFGAFSSWTVAEQVSVQAEALLSAQGINRVSDSDFKMRTLYLNVPLLARYDFTERTSAHAGLQAGFLLRAKLKVEGYDTYDRKEAYKPMDLAFSFGGEYRFNNNIGAGLRFNLGMTSFHREDNEPHQRTVQIFAAYHLR